MLCGVVQQDGVSSDVASAASNEAQIERDSQKDAQIQQLRKNYSQLNAMYQKLSVEKTEAAKFEKKAKSVLEGKVEVARIYRLCELCLFVSVSVPVSLSLCLCLCLCLLVE